MSDALRLTVDPRAYRLTAVQKTLYRLADVVDGRIETASPEAIVVVLTGRKRDDLGALFFRELLDQELREAIADETRSIRALLLAQAFSKTRVLR